MSLLKRLFSSDYRAALAAEAAGDYEVAAERYALAGERAAAVRVHLARAKRASRRADEIKALRDALHWADDADIAESPGAATVADIKARLGRALLSRATEQGVATARDRDVVREAAKLLADGGEHEAAGDALEGIGDDAGAAQVFEAGGLVFRMEQALSRADARGEKRRTLDTAFAEYEVHLAGGGRLAARDALRTCVEVADKKGEYRKLLDDLESRMIAGGRVTLRRRTPAKSAGDKLATGHVVVACGGERVQLGRDSLCDLVLRSGGVSRIHAEIEVGTDDDGARQFMLRDAGSRNGTLIGGLPIAGTVPLLGTGSFSLGDDCRIDYGVDGDPPVLTLQVQSGLDRGVVLQAAGERARMLLNQVARLPAAVWFEQGRPHLESLPADAGMLLNGERIAVGDVELIHGDALSLSGIEVEVE